MPIQPSNQPTASSAIDVTIDAAPSVAPSADTGSGSVAGSVAAQVELVEGSDLGLTRETEELLHRRLRLAATVLAGGFAVFLVNHIWALVSARSLGWGLFVFHAALTALLAAVSVMLTVQRRITLRRLRLIEMLVFGLPLAFFVVLENAATRRMCTQGVFEFRAGPWLLLVFSYALFIPNTIRRAAVVIGVLAGVPMLLLAWVLLSCPEAAALADFGSISPPVLMLILAAVASVFGVDTIGTLRREAFKARQLGQYRLTRRIGAGGMGEVFLAEHQLLKRPCVVKLIRPDKTGNPKVLARFQREVRATAKLSHWNTVEIFDYGSTEDGTFYYVMEHLPGMSLEDLVRRGGPLPPARVIHLLVQACDALAEAHAAKLIHRDIKPGNIFAAYRGGVHDVVKLLDFGLVKPLLEESPMHLTADGSITGSPLYMSPEQALGETQPDVRSDIYSLGAVGYYLLTGRPPFVHDTAMKVLIAHAREEPVPPSQIAANVPPDLQRVILRCLSKDPAERYQSARQLADALGACEAAGGWSRADAAAWWRQQPSSDCAGAAV